MKIVISIPDDCNERDIERALSALDEDPITHDWEMRYEEVKS